MKRFITIEGGEGCGKSTLCACLSDRLEKLEVKHIVTREPGGIDSSEDIRSVIFKHDIDRKSEVLLFAAARNEHLKEKVLPALAKGEYVICDRYVDSSLAYQGHAQGLGIDAVYTINKYVIEDALPEVTFWLDMDPEAALNRISNEREINRFDRKSIEFHEKVREGYAILAKQFPERYVKLDATKSIEQLAVEILEHLCLK